jgi:hypothetical protein
MATEGGRLQHEPEQAIAMKEGEGNEARNSVWRERHGYQFAGEGPARTLAERSAITLRGLSSCRWWRWRWRWVSKSQTRLARARLERRGVRTSLLDLWYERKPFWMTNQRRSDVRRETAWYRAPSPCNTRAHSGVNRECQA